LHALARALVALALLACSKEGGAPREEEAPAGRYDTAAAKPKKAASIDELCDVAQPAGAGPTLAWPPLTGAAPAGGRPRWINLWATWCKPCVAEIPMLRGFRQTLAAEGVAFDLAFVSVDEDDATLARYRADHADAPEGPRLTELEDLPDLLTSIGLDREAPIPVHVFVGADDKIRCVRAGSLRERDLAAVRTLLLAR
jgi:thiol-disulfide isomerase/thioredoxin